MSIDWNISVMLAHSIVFFTREEYRSVKVMACGPEIPAPQDPAISYMEGMVEELKQYPAMRSINAAATKGEKVTVDGTTYDFTGKGEADYQKKVMEQMAEAYYNTQKKYGSDIIKQRLAELEASDPDGVKARKDLYARVLTGLSSGEPDYEAALQLESDVLGDLERGARLSPALQREVSENVRGRQVALGGGHGLADAYREATAMDAVGRGQLSAAQQRALQFLTSGVGKDDKEYRWNQQNMANLGAFLSGETPVAQFGQLSGAQSGVTPFYQGPQMPGIDHNAGLRNMENQFKVYTADAYTAGQQANPLFAGLGTGLQGLNAALMWMPQNNAGGGLVPSGYSTPPPNTLQTPWGSMNLGGG